MRIRIPVTFLKLSIRPWGLLMTGGAVVCVATVLGFLGRLYWGLDLFSHFRVQYLLGLGVLGFVLLMGRRAAAGVILGFACVNLALIAPLYFGGAATAPGHQPVLRAMLIKPS